jgi:uncharacterized protein (UPF0276 family)
MTLVGIAYSGYVSKFIEAYPSQIDFVEVPFELLCHNPQVLEPLQTHSIILHCASLNIAGPVRPPPALIHKLKKWITATRTPWLGEHLAFTTTEPQQMLGFESWPTEPYKLGFTVSPPMNSAAVSSVTKAVNCYRRQLAVPLLLENSPLYFSIPGSSMSQVDFVRKICRKTDVRLLLDLTHFHISSQNEGFDPYKALEDYPLERVDEIHISGESNQCDIWWDDHAYPASDEVFELLARALSIRKPQAITLEYNWSAEFPLDIVFFDLERTRKIVRQCA